jgi:hypothetical protein
MIEQIGFAAGRIVKRLETGYSNGYQNIRARKSTKKTSKFAFIKTILNNLKGA